MAFTFQINPDVKWNRDTYLLEKAEKLKPSLIKKQIVPIDIVKIVKNNNYLNGYQAISSGQSMQSLPEYTLGRDEQIILDLGDHYVGKFSIDINSIGSPMDAPLYLKIKFAEVPAEIPANALEYDGWLSKSWIQEEFFHIDELPFNLELPRRYSCRYIELTVIDSSPKWKASFSNPIFISESSVDSSSVKPMKISDPLLNKINDISIKTLEDCMQDVFEDGPKRDRRLWIGDLRLQALANYATFDDLALVKRCLYLFGAMNTQEGKIAANVFTSPKTIPDDTFLFEYSIFFATILNDYYEHTQEFEILYDLYPIAKKQIDLALTLIDKDGRLVLPEEWPVFIDWSNEFEKATAGQATLIYSLKHFIKLAKVMNDVDLEKYQSVCESLINFSVKYLFDTEKNLFIVEENQEINIASQIWMILAEVFDTEQNKSIMLTALKELFPITGIATPYMYHHIVEALFIADLSEEAVNLMKNYWGKMIDLGADTFWEAFKPEEPHFSPYGGPIISSYCHAWSCTPPYLIKKYLL